ncbi:hypothetical protein P5673_016055, partial [Acropora cervicornis]
ARKQLKADSEVESPDVLSEKDSSLYDFKDEEPPTRDQSTQTLSNAELNAMKLMWCHHSFVSDQIDMEYLKKGQATWSHDDISDVARNGTGCCTLVPLKLNESGFHGRCLLFGDLELLTKTVVPGNRTYCLFVFCSSLVNAVLATLLGFLKSCCIIKTKGMRVVYFQFVTSIVAALAWINSLVCAVFIVIGLTEWCNSVKNNGNVESCKEAEKWNWPSYTPSARNFKQDLLNIRLEEYYLNEERLHYMQQQPVQDDPRYEVRSERGSRYEVRSERGSRFL